MASNWTAQEPAREEWDERNGKRFAVDVLDEAGMLVCVVFGDSAHIAMQRALRVERRAA
jgi:hypothetical protein